MRIATRASALALAQASSVADLLGGAELVEVVTSGDRRRAVEDKREWVVEIEDALERGDADLAVHSAKDVPAELPEGFALAGVPARAAPWDALCGAGSLDDLPEGARIGTSSVRRAAALRALRPDLRIVELRGNVDTRLRKLADGEADAIVLALAGLQRLGREDAVGCVLDQLVPAPGQGTLLLEARLEHGTAREAAAGITDGEAMRALVCERALVRALGADCHTPVGAHAVGGETLTLRAFVGKVDGSAWLRDEVSGEDPEALGAECAQRLLAAGAGELLG
ncbi:MAG TPA: hydroxymethylbilane synthase [Capillimicrobium sp.]|jgi:hydroxymethylbilane synthase